MGVMEEKQGMEDMEAQAFLGLTNMETRALLVFQKERH